jgi:GT2 family glycosyltransferase
VKGKIVESLLTGTPVVTTPIGAEGLGLRDGEHAVVADGPAELAAGLERLLTDGREWQRLADAGHELIGARHGPGQVGGRFLEIVDEVLSLPARDQLGERAQARNRERAYRDLAARVESTLVGITEPGSTVLVVSRGDDALLAVEGRSGQHFPQAPDGRWAGHHPRDSHAALKHLEQLRDGGASYLAVPSPSFWWLNHYRELIAHLDTRHRRIHSSEDLVVFDVGTDSRAPPPRPGPRPIRTRVLVIGSHRGGGPPEQLVAELERAQGFAMTQRWRPVPSATSPLGDGEADIDADWLLYVRDDAVLPDAFVDNFLTAASGLAELGIERVQPAHRDGPEAGPPVSECLHGVLARELEAPTPMPVFAVRRGAATEGPIAIVDSTPIGLAAPLKAGADPLAYSTVRDVFLGPAEAPRRAVQRSQWAPDPLLSVLITTYDRPDLLAGCLDGLCEQTLPVNDFEVVVVDDGSPGPRTEAVLREYAARLPLTWTRIEHAGRSPAKNLAVMLARGGLILFFDDDDVPSPDLLEEQVRAHERYAEEGTAILGHTEWAPGLTVTPLMHYLTEVDQMLFSYGHVEEDKRLGWEHFWEGRVSSKRSLHLRHGLHDQCLAYSIDVEMAWRLARHGLEVIYKPTARSYMARPIEFDEFCRRREAKGRAQAAIARLHDDPDLRRYLQIEGAAERWRGVEPELPELARRVAELERELREDAATEPNDPRLRELHRTYRTAFQAYADKGIAEGFSQAGSQPARTSASANGARLRGPVNDRYREPTGDASGRAPRDKGAEAPALTVAVPLWSRSPDLAAMAVRTIDRVWEVARLPTEVIAVDNGSPEGHPGLRARIFRFEENTGVASGWNKGIELARAPVIAILNSDCWVEPGWDDGLYEAATSGRRIAFPYTDHCDGRGFRRPDQAGTAGWCFMLSREVIEEVGLFDERFNPAYVEDTDYWHRAWELGIELSPVPLARVTHARRTSADQRSDWLLTGHRYLYGWKHGVEPMRAPPYYNREIVDYHPQGSPRSVSTT